MKTYFIDHICQLDTLPVMASNYQVFVTIRLDDPNIYDMVALVVTRKNFWVSRHSSTKVKEILANRYQDKDRQYDLEKQQQRAQTKQTQIRQLKKQLAEQSKKPTTQTHQLRAKLAQLEQPELPKPVLTAEQIRQRNQQFMDFLKRKKQTMDKKLSGQKIEVAHYR